jgi:hypothetical protein
MNEGAISRWLITREDGKETNKLDILEMERANLTGVAARLSAELAGCSEKIQNWSEALGRELGLAWGAWQDQMEKRVIQQSLSRARAILEELPETEVKPLYELYEYMERNLGEVI